MLKLPEKEFERSSLASCVTGRMSGFSGPRLLLQVLGGRHVRLAGLLLADLVRLPSRLLHLERRLLRSDLRRLRGAPCARQCGVPSCSNHEPRTYDAAHAQYLRMQAHAQAGASPAQARHTHMREQQALTLALEHLVGLRLLGGLGGLRGLRAQRRASGQPTGGCPRGHVPLVLQAVGPKTGTCQQHSQLIAEFHVCLVTLWLSPP